MVLLMVAMTALKTVALMVVKKAETMVAKMV